jgi:hypothetical protein
MLSLLRPRFSARALLVFAAPALALLVLCVPRASADATLIVNSNLDFAGGACLSAGPCSLRAAIGNVDNGDVSGDVTITFAVEGVIATGANGPIAIDPPGGVSELTIAGPGADKLTVEGGGQARIFEVLGGDVSFSELTLVAGAVKGSTPGSIGGAALLQEGGAVLLSEMNVSANEVDNGRHGGAVYLGGGDLTVADSIFELNSAAGESVAAKGGAIYESTGAANLLTIEDSTFARNSSEGAGGAVFEDEGSFLVEHSEFADNEAGTVGGAVATDASGSTPSTTVADSQLLSNTAISGGAIDAHNGAGGVLVTRSLLEKNSAVGSGGAVSARGPTTIRASSLLENELSAPAGGFGSAVFVAANSTAIETSTVAMNDGVAVWAGADTSIRNSTIVRNHEDHENSAAGGLGGFHEPLPTVSVTASILAENEGAHEQRDCAVHVTSGGHNLVSESAPLEVDTDNPKCEWTGSGDQTGVDPKLGEIGDNGGPTPTLAPISRLSLAINHGGDPQATDQRGLPRPVPGGAVNTDVGAYEVQAPLAETGPTILAAAELEVGETITCDPGVWDTDGVLDALASFEWLRAGVKIDEGATHQLQAADAGAPLVCRYSLDNGATTTTADTAPVELAPIDVELAPSSLTFAAREINAGASAPQQLTLSNAGGVGVTIGSYSSAGQFPIDAGNCPVPGGELPPHQFCTIDVRFDPTARGAQTGTVTVVTSAGSIHAEAGGTGTAPEIAISPATLDLGHRPVGAGAGAAGSIEVANAGNAPLHLGAVSIEGNSDFSIPGGENGCSNATLQPGEECFVGVVFAPAAAGPRAATVRFAGDDPGSAGVVGVGTEPALAAEPAELEFGEREIGTGPGAPLTVTIRDSGEAPLSIGPVTVGGPGAAAFGIAADGCSGATLQPNGSCQLAVVFAPPAATSWGAHLVLPGTVPGSVALHGVGSSPPPPLVSSPVPPQGRLVLAGGKPLVGNQSGRIPVGISCESPSGEPCRMHLSLLRQGGKASADALAGWDGSLAAGRRETVPVPLQADARSALGRGGTLRALAVLETSSGEAVNASVKLAAPPAPRLKLVAIRPAGDDLVLSFDCRSKQPRCKGRASVTAQDSTALVAGSVSVPTGKAAVRLPLSGPGRRLLAAGRLRVNTQVVAVDSVYNRTAATSARFTVSGK